MALVLKDRVRDTSTTTGTGTLTLANSAPTGYQTFGAAIGDANTTYYTIVNGAEWEVGLGTYTASGTTLSRDTVLASSNSGSLVNFSAGTKDVFGDYPAGKAVFADANGDLNFAGNVGLGDDPLAGYRLNIKGTTADSSGYGILCTDSADVGTFYVRNDGYARVYGPLGANGSSPTSTIGIRVSGSGTSSSTYALWCQDSAGSLTFYVRDDGLARIQNGMVSSAASTAPGIANTTSGWAITDLGAARFSVSGDYPLNVNRNTNDGVIIYLRQAGTAEGNISVSGTTVSYNSFMGSHWAQFLDGSKPEILKGTVMESLDELCVWPGEQPNDRLPKVKVSDTVESPSVYGVFFAWDEDWVEQRDESGEIILNEKEEIVKGPPPTNDMYVAALGAGYVRVGSGYVVSKGMLLDSAGNGCAKPQSDDIVRARTICKVTSNSVVTTYPDGSYVVPCVLMCG